MPMTKTPRYELVPETTVNGKVGKTTIQVIDTESGKTVTSGRANLSDDAERRRLAKVLAEKLGTDPDEMLEKVEKVGNDFLDQARLIRGQMAAQDAAAAAAGPEKEEEDPEAEELRRLEKMPASVRAEADALLRDPDLIDRITDDIELQGVAGEKDLTATLYLVYTSRKLRRPLAARVRGPSTSGKSHVIDSVANLMPSESMIRATQMTPQSLFYMPPGSLRHKLIVAGERSRNEEDEAAETTRALREMISAGRLSKLLPMKTGDHMETLLIEQEGPIAFVESTTLGEVFAEDENRALPLYTDERPEQTARIIAAMGAAYAGQQGDRDPERVRQVHHAAQRMLRRRDILIPFAPLVGSLLPQERVEVRRAFPALMSMVEVSALLHQFQRNQTDDGQVIADRLDYAVAARLLTGAMRRLLGGGISEPARRFGERLREWFDNDSFTIQKATRRETASGCSRRSVYGWVAELREAGVVEKLTEAAGKTAANYQLTNLDPNAAAACALPTCDKVFHQEDACVQ
jgi:hypothetical protein